jgi:hypothetical protein
METKPTPTPSESAEDDQRIEDVGKVIPFRPRHSTTSGRVPATHSQDAGPEDLAKYERDEGEDDYRHRMFVNAAALAVTVTLAAAGAWLAITIGEMRKNQDCYLSGRRNCMPIDVPAMKPK